MRLVLDISAVPYGTGVSLYTANLAQALARQISSADSLIYFGSSFRQKSALAAFSPAKIYPLPPKLISFLFHNLNLSPSLFVKNCDVFHSWDWYAPNPNHVSLVSTVHDLALFKFPNTAHSQIEAHHRASLTRLKQFKAQIIAVSHTTKNDLIELFGFDEKVITVIPEALPQEHKLSPPPLSVSKPYFLLVGTQEPRKNLKRQIEAWRPYKKDFDLILAGKSGWDTIREETGLHLTGQVTPAGIASLYRGAAVLLYASLYEGFGLPILEAFYHQVPVVTSDISSMPEVAGSAAILVDPHEVDSIALGIKQALDQKDQLVNKGLRRLQVFSWDATAKATLAVYRKAYACRH